MKIFDGYSQVRFSLIPVDGSVFWTLVVIWVPVPKPKLARVDSVNWYYFLLDHTSTLLQRIVSVTVTKSGVISRQKYAPCGNWKWTLYSLSRAQGFLEDPDCATCTMSLHPIATEIHLSKYDIESFETRLFLCLLQFPSSCPPPRDLFVVGLTQSS